MVGATGKPTFVELYTPKLITVLREGYRLRHLRSDAISGLTVAIVALPLSMAIAIACGVTPDRGIVTAVIGGFLVSLLGGSRFQVGGPAGAFIVLVATTVGVYGIDGLVLATFLGGFILLAIGFLRLGTFIKYIPYPVTVGFTAGIGIIIFASQLKELLGLTLVESEPAEFLPKLEALRQALGTFNVSAVGLAVMTIVAIIICRRLKPRWPGLLIAVALASVIAALVGLPVETIGTRFGGIPHSLPAMAVPEISWARIFEVLPAAISFALLGSIESLLSAVVADSMTGRRHRSNSELVAQGVANIGSSLFGGIPVTGTIARTATNVRSGAHGPIAGMLHSVFLLLFMLFAAPLASYIPLAALAGVLTTVAWGMLERHAIGILLRASIGDAVVLGATLLLTIFRDLTTGIVVGFGLAALLFLHRLAQSVEVEGVRLVEGDRADFDPGEHRVPYMADLAIDQLISVFRINGAFFFGAAASVATALDRIGNIPKAYVVDFAAVPMIDSTAAATIAGFTRKAHRQGAAVYLSGARPQIRHALKVNGLQSPDVHFETNLAEALVAARMEVAKRQCPELPGGTLV